MQTPGYESESSGSLEENKLLSTAVKNKKAANMINLMDNKAGDQRIHSLNEETKQSML